MSMSELLLTLLVTLLVFGPSKLPMLARHIGLFILKLNKIKQQINIYLEHQLQENSRAEALQNNIKKAEAADESYQLK